jgi:hypothetical protein
MEDRCDARSDRLERMIERLVTQRACLDYAAQFIADIPGVILEVGLGKGRTFDHLRRLFPERELYAFDRDVHAPADVVPDGRYLVLGDFRQTLAAASTRLGHSAALIHADIGSEDSARDRALAAAIAPLVVRLLRPGALVVTDRELAAAALVVQSLPPAVGRFPYFIYRAAPESSEGPSEPGRRS